MTLNGAQKAALRRLVDGFGPLSYRERETARRFHAMGLIRTNNIQDPSYVTLSEAGKRALEEHPSRDARRRRDPSAEVDLDAFNARLAKLVTGLKKDAGAETIRQNYKGTGSRKHRRQLWIRFKSGAVIDLWLDSGFAQLGGVVTHGAVPGAPPLTVKRIPYAGKTPEEVYREIASVLGPWANPETARDRDRGWWKHPRLHRRAARLGIARHPRKKTTRRRAR